MAKCELKSHQTKLGWVWFGGKPCTYTYGYNRSKKGKLSVQSIIKLFIVEYVIELEAAHCTTTCVETKNGPEN